MEDLLSTLGVFKQTEQDTTKQVLRDKIKQSISFHGVNLKQYSIENLVSSTKVEGLPRLSLPSLLQLRKELNLRRVKVDDDDVKLKHMIKLKFVDSLIQKEQKSSKTNSNNRSILQSIIDSSATNDSDLLATRRAAKLMSSEELAVQNKLSGVVFKSYHKRGSMHYSDNSNLSLNIYAPTASDNNSLNKRAKLNEDALEDLMREARSENAAHNVVAASSSAASSKTTMTTSQSCADSTGLLTDEMRISADVASVDDDHHSQSSHRRMTARSSSDHSAATPKRTSRQKSVPATDTAPNADEIICPICSRVIESAVMLDRHVDRCGRRRGSAVASYSEDHHPDDATSGAVGTGAETSARKRGRKSAAGSATKKSARQPADWEEGEVQSEGVEEGEDEEFGGSNGSEFELEFVDDAAGRKKSTSRATRSTKSSKYTKSTARGFIGGGRLKRNSSAQSLVAAQNKHAEETYNKHAEETYNSDADEDVDVDVLGGTGGDVAGIAYAADDWEDEDYVSRLQGLPAQRTVTVETPYGTAMCGRTFDRLYDYQREGTQWLFDLYQEGVGGILGDEMGLGKTAQLCAHFDSLSHLQQLTNRTNNLRRNNSALFLVVCPATVLQHWLSEFHAWAPSVRTVILHAISATGNELSKLGDEGIELVLKKLKINKLTQGLAVITTYEGLRKHKAALTVMEWTAVCLDEGQKIRNPHADITTICKTIPAFHRVILSGTPIQNNLKELWSLFDFIYPGRIGVLPVFEAEFSTPIRVGGYLNATKLEYEVAVRCAATLQRIIKPYLLRRKKEDLQLVTKLPPKTEQVLFCQISPLQREIYMNILGSSEVKAVLERRTIAFRAINTLRKLCNHPALMFSQGKVVWHSEKARGRGDGDSGGEEDEELAVAGGVASTKINWSDSGKLLVLSKVLPLWHSEGHKVLIFCQTRSMLGIIEAMVRELRFQYRRLDGNTPIGRRASLIDEFNGQKDVFVMLLTTRTGGVGISLTSANRVVVFDPDWNPMTDIQSRERAWRLGQQREVTIYRLITRGTIEEKIYQRQIFKLLLSSRILDNPRQKALFSKSDIKELFQLQEGTTGSGAQANGNNCSTSGDTSGDVYEDKGHNLPLGGEVDLQTRSNSTSGMSAAHITAAVELEEGEVMSVQTTAATITEHTRSSTVVAVAEEGGGSSTTVELDVETYVHQEIPDQVLSEIMQTTSESGSSGNNNSSSGPSSSQYNDRDRRLLQALFEGEAITSVYDHDYLEGEKNDRPALSKESVVNKHMAMRVVDRKVQSLVNSSISYNSGSLLTAGGIGQASAAPNDTNYSVPAITNKFSSRSASSGSTLSSAALLGGLRAHQNVDLLGSVLGRGSSAGNNSTHNSSGVNRSNGASFDTNNNSSTVAAAYGASNIASGVASSGGRFSNAMNSRGVDFATSTSAAGGSVPRISVQQDITNRLNALFHSSAAKYTTTAVLNRFRDLGDQYAPLFKECLRSVAVLNDGQWSKK